MQSATIDTVGGEILEREILERNFQLKITNWCRKECFGWNQCAELPARGERNIYTVKDAWIVKDKSV